MKKIYYIFIFLLLFSFSKVFAETTTEDYLENVKNKLVSIENKQNSRTSVDSSYPVGSIYISVNSTNPSSFFGGSWQRYAEGKTLVGVDGGTYKDGQTGGSATKTLSYNNIPSHNHTLTASGSVSSSFSGWSSATSWVSHNHSINMYTTSNESGTQHALVNKNSSDFSNRVIVNSNNSSWSSSSGAHSHWITPTGNVWSSFSGSWANTNSTGSSTPFNVMNPYITVYIWRRTA